MVLGALPIATKYMVRAMSFAGTETALLYRCNFSMCSGEDRVRLQAMTTAGKHRYEAAYTMALVSKRAEGMGRGAFSEARRMGKLALSAQETAQAHTLLGNIEYAEALKHCDGVKGDLTSEVLEFDAVSGDSPG